MAVKYIEVPGIGRVSAYKRKGSRSIRISVADDGTVRVTLPNWAPYKTAVAFVLSKADWIAKQQNSVTDLVNNQPIGKAHHLLLIPDPTTIKISSRVKGTEIIITYPAQLRARSSLVQGAAKAAGIRALRREADNLLPKRLETLAAEHSFSYASVSVRQLKTRWGSCNSRSEITLNIFLMQLPWHLIDYVLLHELTHTKVMQHGPKFWAELQLHLPEVQKLRKEIRAYKSTF